MKKQRNIPKKKVSRFKIDKEAFMIAVINSGGVILPIAKRMGVAYHNLLVFVRLPENAECQEALRYERIKMVDLAEARLFKKVNEGADWAIKYVLSNLGKDRGYNALKSLEESKPAEIHIHFEEPSNEKRVEIIDVEKINDTN